MNNFDLTQKTHILFGRGEENKTGQLIKSFSDSCLIVHDGGRYLETLLERVKKSLSCAGISFTELSGVKANPLVSKANEGISLCKSENLGFVLAIGGGSVMDTAKYIAYAAYCNDNPLLLQPGKEIKHRVLPHGAIVTLSGTSSECSNCAMIMDDLHTPLIKYAMNHTALYFDFSIVNPEFAYSLPPKQTASGAMDAISHALEVYLAPSQEEPLMEGYMETVIRTVLRFAPMALKNPTDYKVRALLSIAAMMAFNDNISNGGIPQDWGGHGVEKPVTSTFNGTHGTTLGIITPAFLRFTYKKNPRPFVNFSVRCMGVSPEGKTEAEIVDEGASRLEDWLHTMDLPTRLHEIGLTADMLKECAAQAAPAGAVYQLTEDEVMQIYKMCE